MYNRVTLLGNAQDAGRPQFACTKPCCEDARLNSELSRMPVSGRLRFNCTKVDNGIFWYGHQYFVN